MVLDVAHSCRPIQVIQRSLKRFRRQEVVPGRSRKVEDGPDVVLVIYVISRILRRFRRQEVVLEGYRKVEDGPEVVLVWSPWNSSVMKAIQMVLDVAHECRPIQVILRSFKKFRRQEVVPGGSIRGKDGPEVVLVWSLCDSSVKKSSKWF